MEDVFRYETRIVKELTRKSESHYVGWFVEKRKNSFKQVVVILNIVICLQSLLIHVIIFYSSLKYFCFITKFRLHN